MLSNAKKHAHLSSSRKNRQNTRQKMVAVAIKSTGRTPENRDFVFDTTSKIRYIPNQALLEFSTSSVFRSKRNSILKFTPRSIRLMIFSSIENDEAASF